jgi:hypothetical protein
MPLDARSINRVGLSNFVTRDGGLRDMPRDVDGYGLSRTAASQPFVFASSRAWDKS